MRNLTNFVVPLFFILAKWRKYIVFDKERELARKLRGGKKNALNILNLLNVKCEMCIARSEIQNEIKYLILWATICFMRAIILAYGGFGFIRSMCRAFRAKAVAPFLMASILLHV